MCPGEHEILVRLVAQDPEIVLPGQLVHRPQCSLGEYGAGGVAGAVDHDGAGPRRDQCPKRRQFRLISGAERVEYGAPAEEQDLLDVVGPVDLGNQHLVAGAEQDLQRGE